uniref:Dicarbonyl and L-xylulose reductase n=1 Tax=Naja naja TaxID=35670 RepID=A0A8C6XSK1_NAJNA
EAWIFPPFPPPLSFLLPSSDGTANRTPGSRLRGAKAAAAAGGRFPSSFVEAPSGAAPSLPALPPAPIGSSATAEDGTLLWPPRFGDGCRQRSFSVNLRAVLQVSQIFAQKLIARGAPGVIVNVSSQASQRAMLNHTVYSATKSALDMLTKSMALELGPHKIRVNCVNPTVVMTNMGRLNWSDPQKSGPMLSRIPLGKFAELDDVVNGILFLLSDQSNMTTGATLPIDGGFLSS